MSDLPWWMVVWAIGLGAWGAALAVWAFVLVKHYRAWRADRKDAGR